MTLKEIGTSVALVVAAVVIALVVTPTKSTVTVKSVKLPKGRKLVEVVWKTNSPFYLTRKMDKADSAQTYFLSYSDFKTDELIIIETK